MTIVANAHIADGMDNAHSDDAAIDDDYINKTRTEDDHSGNTNNQTVINITIFPVEITNATELYLTLIYNNPIDNHS